mgnify:FL=1
MASESLSAIAQEIFFVVVASSPPTVSAATLLDKLQTGSPDAPNGDHAIGSQFITVFAQMSTAAATATITFFCADDDSATSAGTGKLWADTATITAGSIRTSHNTSAGGYVATVVFAISGKNTLDIHPVRKTWPKWYATATALSAGTCTIQVVAGRAI